jgi:NodT family efflux transporter outer membrane factor (OMF) lipoprotein
MRPSPSLPFQVTAPLLLLLAGCTVGPTYSGPPTAAPKAAKAAAFVRAGTDTITSTAPVARWWEALDDQTLNALIVRALANNPNVTIADARLRQARTALRLEKANALPKANASALYAHARLPGVQLQQSGSSGTNSSGGGGSTDLNLYNVGFDASWEIDLFGGQRRAIEAARATTGAAEADLADAQVSLSAEVAQAYLNLRERQRRIALSQTSVGMQEQMLGLTRQRLDRGTASKLDLTRLQNQLDDTRAELDSYLNALATLTGDEPGALDASLSQAQPIPLPPAQVAVGDPARLLQNRPDIRAAERRLATDTAKIGQAEAARFPSLSFMGIIGLGGTKASNLTNLDDFTALMAPQLSWNFLDFGRNKARVIQAEGVRDETEARYRSAILAALRDAEDSLSRFRYRRMTVATLARAKAEADQVETLSEQRYRAGTATLIDLLDARRQQISAEQNLVQAEAHLAGDFVAIQKALGLGWQQTE